MQKLPPVIKYLRKSRVVSTASIYTVSNVVNSALPFLMMPILTRFLSPEDYGIVAMYLFALGIAAPFLGNNLSLLSLKKATSLDDKNLSIFIWTGFSLIGIISLAVFLVSQLPFLKPLISEAIFLPENWIWVVLIGAASQNITTTLLTYFQSKTQPLKYAVFQVGQSIFIVVLSLSLVAGFDMHWQGRVIAIAVSFFLFAIVALIYFLKKLKFSKPSKAVAGDIIRSGVPLILHSLGFIIMSMVDRYLVSKLVGIGPAGVYMVAVQFASVMYMIGDGLYKATSPWVFQKLSDQDVDSSRILKINLAKVSGILFLIAGVWAFVAPYAIEIFAGEMFHDAGDLVRPLIFAWTFYAIQQQFSNFFYHSNRTLTLGLISGAITIFNVIITYTFIDRWGLLAAPYATLISFSIWALLTLHLGVRKKSDPNHLKILFSTNDRGPWIDQDYNLLSKQHIVKKIMLSKVSVFYFWRWLFHLIKSDILFVWFGSLVQLIPVLVARLLGKKIILVVGGFEVAKEQEIKHGGYVQRSPLIFLRSFLFKLPHKILAVSEASRKDCLNNAKIPAEKVELLYHGFSAGEEDVVDWNRRGDHVVMIAQATRKTFYVKGIDQLLKLCLKAPDIQFVLIGSYDDFLTSKIKELGIKNLQLKGYLDFKGAAFIETIGTSKTAIQLSYYESFCSAIVDAGLMGCYPIVYDKGALPEVVTNIGTVIKYGDLKAVVDEIRSSLMAIKAAPKDIQEKFLIRFPSQQRSQKLLSILKDI